MVTRTGAWTIVLALLMSIAAGARQQAASIRGIVFDTSGTAAAGVAVVLLDGLGSPLATVRSDPAGRFQFTDVAPGSYSVLARERQQRSAARHVTIETALPVDI